MTDEEYDERMGHISELFWKWWDANPDLTEKSIREILGEAFFAGYEECEKELKNEKTEA